jgi:hypothetical protein
MIEVTIIELRDRYVGGLYQPRIFRVTTERKENDKTVCGSGNDVRHVC